MVYIRYPCVPFTYNVKNIGPGVIIQVAGTVVDKSKGFIVNIQCGPNNEEDDIVLHMQVLFNFGNKDAASVPTPAAPAVCTVSAEVKSTPAAAAAPSALRIGNFEEDVKPFRFLRNSREKLEWGEEETFGRFPFNDRDVFDIIILCVDDRFKVAVNDKHCTDFDYRMPIERISHIFVDGAVKLIALRIQNHDLSLQRPNKPRELVHDEYLYGVDADDQRLAQEQRTRDSHPYVPRPAIDPEPSTSRSRFYHPLIYPGYDRTNVFAELSRRRKKKRFAMPGDSDYSFSETSSSNSESSDCGE